MIDKKKVIMDSGVAGGIKSIINHKNIEIETTTTMTKTTTLTHNKVNQ